MDQRPIPPAAFRDEKATEMLRVWIAEGKLHCSLKIGMYQESGRVSEAEAWGVILADAIRHIAAAMREGFGASEDTFCQEIVSFLLKEVKQPTSGREGEFVS